ncbi:AAA family ATPase [Pseudomonas syringae Cit 7]|uniref:AAA family ATPase n=1 Tax=Pseudomonas syringae Cit 7 TaxID=629264 RepID=A0A8T8LTU3_PSESX|nr:AAA family ATPase [Pseudomonas syringae]MDU8419687.1 AAA family ATPase [Pseudomonas syringae]QUP64810.1 AAA family ATPase [Pseudomonas syringae Cit 7]SDT01659.1 AAA domain-containing protein [Pseudomonas syringae]
MQYIQRDVPVPAILTGSAANEHREFLVRFMAQSEEQLSQKYPPASSLNLSDQSMSAALKRLFIGRCAFCEAWADLMPYRFRPKSQSLPYEPNKFAHFYYSWLDIAWQNIYPICHSCLPADGEYFPVLGKRAPLPDTILYQQYAQENTGMWPAYPLREKSILLDPCFDQALYKELGTRSDGSLVGLSERGSLTIKHFNLNAATRTAERFASHQEYLQQLLQWVGEANAKESIKIFDFKKLEFGGSWYFLLRRLAIFVGAKTISRPVLSMAGIARVFAKLLKIADGRSRLEQCIQQLADNEPQEFSSEDTIMYLKRPSTDSVTSLRIENFKSIEHLDINLRPQTPTTPAEGTRQVPALLIIGENSAGKSTILEALALGLSSTQAFVSLGLTTNNFILAPEFLGAAQPRAVSRALIEIGISNGSKRTLLIEQGGINIPDEMQQENIPVFAYGAFRQYQHQGPSSKPKPDAFVHNLFDGRMLPNPERWLLKLSDARFPMVIRALREILSIDGRFDVIRRDIASKQCYVVTGIRDDGSPLSQSSLKVASSGFRSILAMACDVMRGLMNPSIYPDFESLQTARAVVLIDEVEAHLHPRWKMRIMRGLREALPNVTFIATTHDPLCIRGMNDGEIVVLRRVQLRQGTTDAGLQSQVEAQTDLPPLSELRIEQLLTSDLFQLHSTDDPEMDQQFAHIADLLAIPSEQLEPEQLRTLKRFNDDVASALPVGTSEAHRVVQDAVAEYLQIRARTSVQRVADAKASVKAKIIQALEGIL